MPDLFDFFKENESKLQERPPEQAWSRLENRLDKRRRKRRGIRFLHLSTISVLLVLLALAVLMVLFFMR